ncbi:MAG TPA: M48 family metalloprotease [Woeseiaceae bacterium]|nr:M48 family metalloprotease [Woeseiaceae bacterium]
MKQRISAFLLVLAVAAGCAVNPVTGERELVLVGVDRQIAMGEQNYLPMRQAQGGQYDIDPELTEYVQSVGQKLAAVSDLDLPYEFVVLNNSVPNAWALPGGKIAVNRGLLTALDSEAELAAVLGHEIVHAAAGHSANQIERGMLLQGLVLGTAIATSDSDYGRLAVMGANVGAQLVNLKYGREAELEADYYGMQYMSEAGYDPQGAVSLQKTFVELAEEQNTDRSWLAGLFSSHPPSEERVQANIRTAASLPPGGIIGEERFEEAMAKTMEVRPAYEAYDAGRKALAEGNTELALEKADKAISIFPGEAHFYALRGDARMVNGRYERAVESYDEAIERRDDFFYYYLQRGLAYNELGREERAVDDLQKSLTYLPTAPAHYTLGNIALERGNRAAAVEHLKVVAGGQGEMAEAARASLIRLDLAQNPASYILTGCDADSEGNLVVLVKNNTPVPVTDVGIAVQFRNDAGVPRRLDRRIGGVIPPGQVVSLRTGLGPYVPGSACPVQVIGARVAR